MVFIEAKTGPANYGDAEAQYTVQYFDENGNMTIRSGGTRAWRSNNPGNLKASPYSMGKDRRPIGKASDGVDTYAVYPDYETGHEALVVMLKGSVYSPLTLRAAMKRYEEKKKDYIDIIVSKTGFDPERTVKSLNKKEFKMFWQAIEETEDWKVGRENFIPKWYITGVHKKRGVIYEYLVQKEKKAVWVLKVDAVKMGEEGRLHAVVVHLKNNRAYLRPEYGTKSFQIVV